MAPKEAMVIILDVGKGSSKKDKKSEETFIDKEKKCCIKLFQRKIFSAKNDEIGLVLMGTKDTNNDLNETMEGYENISKVAPLSVPTWDTVRAIINKVEYQGSSADWLDAIIVAMDIIRSEKEMKKFQNFKIVLFTTFSTYVNDDNVSSVIQGLKSMDIELIVISDIIEHSEEATPDSSQLQTKFSQQEKSENQRLSEELVSRIVEETGGDLCNFDFAVQHLIKFQRRKASPWYWHCTLEIGSKIQIETSSLIAVKQEQHVKWENESGIENTKLCTVNEYYKNGEKIDPDRDELIKGYMLGTTPVPYDESLGILKESTQKGLKCIGFAKQSNLNDEFLSGEGSYMVLPRKGNKTTEQKFLSLVQAMIKSNVVMIAEKVFMNGGRRKLVVLTPNVEHEYPCLTMVEMYYGDHYCYWSFPPLKTKKTEFTSEQSVAVEKLMDAMNLENDETETKELFLIKSLPHISLQHVYETVTKRALNPKSVVPTLNERLAEALEIPSEIKQKTKEVFTEIKNVFPLKEVKKPGKRELIRNLGDIPGLPEKNAGINQNENLEECNVPNNSRLLIEVGTVTPGKDFLLLTERGEDFQKISAQICNIICDLIFKSITNQNEKIAEAMMTFREEAKFHGPWEYNDWIKELKSQIIMRKKFDFWEKVVVGDKLGLIPISQSDLVTSITDEEAEEFYIIGGGTTATATAVNDDENMDELFENM